MQANTIKLAVLLCIFGLVCTRWTEKQAFDWYRQYLWGAGVNYIPAYADNEI